MFNARIIFLLAAWVSLWLPATALAAPPALRDGDLIFQESQSAQSSAILAATGSRFTHMGIVATKDGAPTVIEASAHVRQIPLAKWIAQGRGAHYAVYRDEALTPAVALRVIAEAQKYLGRPYDIYFRFGDDRIYCSELPLLAFRSAGIELGKIETLEALNTAAPQVRALFLRRWRDHPDCRARAKTADACWQIVLHQEILTPASIAADRRLKRVFSNF